NKSFLPHRIAADVPQIGRVEYVDTFEDGGFLYSHSVVTPSLPDLRPRPTALTIQQIREIQRLREENPSVWTINKVAKKFNCSGISLTHRFLFYYFIIYYLLNIVYNFLFKIIIITVIIKKKKHCLWLKSLPLHL